MGSDTRVALPNGRRSVEETAWPIRVCIVAPTPEIVGGQSVQAASLIARLEELPRVQVWLAPINPRLWKSFRWIRNVKYVRTIVNQLVYVPSLFRQLRKADIVHVFSASYFSFILAPMPALIIAKLYGKRTVLHYHSGEAEDHLARWGRTAIPTLRLADRILVPSSYLVEVFARFGLDAVPIPNFVRRDMYARRRRARPRPVLLSNRNLHGLYNVACILRAFDKIQERYPDASLIIAGDGPERRRLKRLSSSLGLRNVLFVGQVAPDRMAQLYDEADIYINASEVDNMPLSILESFASGLPVVSSDAGGIPFFARHEETALLASRNDDEGLAAGVCRLIEEPGLAERLTRNAYDVFHRRYSWEAVGRSWLDLYADLLASPLRIVMVAPTTRILGGQAVQAERLRVRLERSEDIDVRLLPVNPTLPRPLAWLQRIKYVRTLVTEMRYVWTLWFALRKADAVHIFSAAYLSFVLAPAPALVVARLLGKRSILNYRSGEADDHLRRWKRTAIPTMRLADRIIVGSDYLVGVFARYGFAADAIPNIVEVDRYSYRERETLRPVLLANRNFEAHYNVGDVLRAFAIVKGRYPEARLIVAGEGPRRASLEALAVELEIRDAVDFLGQVPPEEMPALYDRADIYVNASLIDNMPTSLIEAFASGTPVVTSSSGGIPMIVEHERTGWMVPPEDFEALASAVLHLLENPEMALRMAREAREVCMSKYTWKAVHDQWLRAYRELAVGGLSVPAKRREEVAAPHPSATAS